MAKIINKSDCKFIEGRIVSEDEVLYVPKVVFDQLNAIEEGLQKAEYIMDQPSFHEPPSLKGFKRETMVKLPFVEKPKLSEHEKQFKSAQKIMLEADQINQVSDINGMIVNATELFQWVKSDYVQDSGEAHGVIDTPRLGDPLELTEDKLVEAMAAIVSASRIEGFGD